MKMLQPLALFSVAASFTLLANAAPIAPMHGAMETPVARQVFCYNAQDYYWPEDGSAIKSPGCRAAYQHVYEKFGKDAQQAVYQFQQWHEVSKNVADHRNMEAVKKAIPDGQLCSAGNSVDPAVLRAARTNTKSRQLLVLANDKSGLDVAAKWDAQPLNKGADNKVHMRYKIMAAHNPSYWQIYISKPGYVASERPLKWSDLELLQEIGNVDPVNGYYDLDVDLKDNTGERVIYSRWQRDDPVGEGFYNCSDVNIVPAN